MASPVGAASGGEAEVAGAGTLEEAMEGPQRQAILAALREHYYHRGATAKALGISLRNLTYKLQRMRERGLEVDRPAGL